MENQTCFDLNAAIENWRSELAAQPNFTADNRRELETHLRDAIAGFRQRGLNDEESFWLARLRTGQPRQLSGEFGKADPAKAWREQAFWLVLVLSLIEFWRAINNYLSEPINNAIWYHHLYLPFQWLYNYSVPLFEFYRALLTYVPIVCLIVIFARGQMNWVGRAFQFIFRSRWQFVLTALIFVVTLDFCFDRSTFGVMVWPDGYWFIQSSVNLLFNQIYLLGFIALIAWLMPIQNQKNPKRT